MAPGCLVLLALAAVITGLHSQPDSLGFISVDCGLAANSSSVDSNTKLTYVSDDQFIDTGVKYGISSQYATNILKEYYLTVRSFPNGTRNCYTIRSLKIGSKYLIRGLYMYGNYDKLNKLPTFDVHLGVNYWDTVEITAVDGGLFTEIIATTTSDYLQVCLINKNLGTPFISALELRPLQTSSYKLANSTQSLVTFQRWNLGESNVLRYPDDPYDRVWAPYMQKTWRNVSTSSKVAPETDFVIPSGVMQTAATTLSTKQSLDLSWDSDKKYSLVFLVILHFSEIEDILSTDLREFNIYANRDPVFKDSTVPKKKYAGWASYTHTNDIEYNVSLKATSNSSLPPLLNAFELYVVTPATGILTNNDDVTAINTIKTNYKLNKGWSGDPCVPTELSWTGVTCTTDSTNIPRITALNLSSCGLTGAIISSFGKLSSLKSLDLSSNDLSGGLPTLLERLTALTYLDITGNSNISTNLPPALQKKQENGTLTYRFEDSIKPSNNKKKIPVVLIAAVGVILVFLIAVAIITILCLKKPKREGKFNFKNRQFTYGELKRITNSFQNKIGIGGFGSVYMGILANQKVAVKMHSDSSSQGVKEFLAEAKNLTIVHHKNLVSLMGYCRDGDCMALVYEYMQEGTLQDKLRDNGKPLTWKQRVQIAYESAQGLEYLHKACNPPLIHRDVKTSNILLNANLEAKIADFGLSRAFNYGSSHVSTTAAGTPGYLDPEYHSLYQPSEKSDVFSFGVVLLEIITGKPPIIQGPDRDQYVTNWVSQKLSRGDIENIVDQRMHGQYDINSVWKVTDLACRCTDNSSAQRPTMSVVVAELKESLDLEISTEGICSESRTFTNSHNYSRNDNSVSDFETACMESLPALGPATR